MKNVTSHFSLLTSHSSLVTHNLSLVMICFLLSAFCLPLYAQVDTRGREFWLTFGPNYTFLAVGGLASVDLQIRIVSGEKATTGTIYFTATNETVSVNIPPNQVFTHVLTASQRTAVYNELTSNPQPSPIVTNRSIHIITSEPVTTFALNQVKATADATAVLPVTALGKEYYHISYKGSTHVSTIGAGAGRDCYVVVATEDNTQVSRNGTLLKTLNKGELCFQYTDTGGDETGAHITANKPVAFFAANQNTIIPAIDICCEDLLFEQLPPVHTWGKKFFVPVSDLGRDIVRIVASQDNTIVTQTGGKIAIPKTPLTNAPATYTLNAGTYVEFMVPLSGKGCYIEADKPVGICTYLTSQDYNADLAGIIGDPAQAWLPPLEQTVNSALIAPFIPAGATNLDKHYALIVTSTLNKNSTTVSIGGGTATTLTGGVWSDNSIAGMSFYTMPLTNSSASYLFSNPKGLILMGYGTGSAESYYYLASSSMRNLKLSFFINEIHYLNFSEIICKQPVEFRAEIDGKMSSNAGHIRWYIDGIEEVSARDSITWKKTFSADGVYQIRMIVLAEDNLTNDTLETSITITQPPVFDPLDNLFFCNGDHVPAIDFTGVNVNPNNCIWTVTNGDGKNIGMSTNSGTGNIPEFTADNNGSVEITVTSNFAANCEVYPIKFTITVGKPVLEQPQDIVLCADETVPSVFFIGTNADTIVWVAVNGTTIGLPANSGTGNLPSFTAVNNDSTSVSAEITATPKSGGCEGEPKIFTITVHYKEPLTVDLGNDTIICKLDSMLLNATHPQADTYQWQDNSTGKTYTVYRKEGDFWVIVEARCNKASDTINIKLFKDIKVDLGKDIAFCEDDIVYKELNATTPGASSYLWQDGSTVPMYVATEPGIYSVTASNICMSVSDAMEVKIKNCDFLRVWIPNAFSPNGNGQNDLFKLEVRNPELLKEYEMAIYNRWGNLLFITKDYQTGWNGKDHKNMDCSTGVYTAIIRYVDNMGREFIKQAAVTLVR